MRAQEFRGAGDERGPCARRRGVLEVTGTVSVSRGTEQAERRPLPAAASRCGGCDRVVRRRPGTAAGPSRDGTAAQPRRVTCVGAARRGRRGRGGEVGAFEEVGRTHVATTSSATGVSLVLWSAGSREDGSHRRVPEDGCRGAVVADAGGIVAPVTYAVAATASARRAAAHSGVYPLWSRRTEGDEGVVRGRRWPQRPQAWVASSVSAAADAELATTTGGKNADGRRSGGFSGQWCSDRGRSRGSIRDVRGVRLSDRTSWRWPSQESA